ncbi:MAG TPA: gliding motility-associated ABC transporter substrate-binding protein GldG [Bacteroidia bacterium]|jgi:ABC-2 type transport system permease protein
MKNKKRDITALGLSILVIVLLNFVASFVFHRFDLTSEKRYTLSPATKTLLGKLDETIYVKVYLEGEFPAGFKRLRNETREMLDEFRTYSNNNIEYEFINPSANPDKAQQNEVYKQLYDKGLQPTNLEVKEASGTSQQVIWPGALVSYKGSEAPWQLLKTQLGVSSEGQLNNSIQGLEYEFASTIRSLSTTIHHEIGFLEGHGELDTLFVDDIKNALGQFYGLKRVAINGQLDALDGLEAIVIAKPDTTFSKEDKFVIDQFIMRGGKVLWCIDVLETRIDSLARSGRTLAVPYDLGLEEMLFKYGVRINQNLVLDLQSSALPVNTAYRGQQPKIELKPWIFSPVILPTQKHPVVKNLDAVKLDFTSSIDLVEAPGIEKTVLLTTSKNSKTINSPVRVDMRIMQMPQDEVNFRNPKQPVAVLLEGAFESVFKNRSFPPEFLKEYDFKKKGINNKMIVIADGDVIRNDVQTSSGKPYPLGYDKYTNQTFGNRDFILNCINYLCDDSGLISVRSRELTLRLLDKKRVKTERLKWQVINVGIPLMLVLIYGIIHFMIRKRRYGK